MGLLVFRLAGPFLDDFLGDFNLFVAFDKGHIKSVRLKKRQLFEMVILQPFLVILSPTTLISFTKLRFEQSF